MEPATEQATAGPSVTPDAIDAEIHSEHYFTALQGARMEGLDYIDKLGQVSQPQPLEPALGLLTICVLVLRNGYTVLGKSACASPENFNELKGREIARKNAIEQIWPLLGFRLRDQLVRQVVEEIPQELQQVVVDEGPEKPLEIGDQILFYERVGDITSFPMLSLVTTVLDNDHANLVVFGPDGSSHARGNVLILNNSSPPPGGSLPHFGRRK